MSGHDGKVFNRYYHSANRINLPTYLFVSKEYNIECSEIEISGVMQYHRDLFEAISKAGTVEEAASIFERYIEVLFDLKERVKGKPVANCMKVLKGWLFDANSNEGAVLKGWIESRFGLIPFYHKEKIPSYDSPEYHAYLKTSMNSRMSGNAMYRQLDLLYTYTQHIIRAYFPDYMPKITLYRGVNDLSDHLIVEQYSKRHLCIEQNSITSFTSDKGVAETFGDVILKTEVPYTKLFFFSGVLPTRSFAGEMEYLVIGGRYDTEILT